MYLIRTNNSLTVVDLTMFTLGILGIESHEAFHTTYLVLRRCCKCPWMRACRSSDNAQTALLWQKTSSINQLQVRVHCSSTHKNTNPSLFVLRQTFTFVSSIAGHIYIHLILSPGKSQSNFVGSSLYKHNGPTTQFVRNKTSILKAAQIWHPVVCPLTVYPSASFWTASTCLDKSHIVAPWCTPHVPLQLKVPIPMHHPR